MPKYFYELSLWEQKAIQYKKSDFYFDKLESGTELFLAGAKIDGNIIFKSFIRIEPKRNYGEAMVVDYVTAIGTKELLIGLKGSNYELVSEIKPITDDLIFNFPDELNIKKIDVYTVENTFQDYKVEQLGAHDSEFEGAAFNVSITKNINGMNTLTFSLFKKYFDWKKNEMVDNPLVERIVNRSLIRLKYKKNENDEYKWYSFVVNEKEEGHSDGKITYTYTCRDAAIDELSRTGYNLTFSEDSVSSMGNIDELAEKVLEGTDWKYKSAIYNEDGTPNNAFLEKETIVKRLEDGTIEEKEEIKPVEASEYNETVDKVVYQYHYRKDESEEWQDTYEDSPVWGYDSYNVVLSSSVRNILYNGKDFTDTTGWISTSGYTDETYTETKESCQLNTYSDFDVNQDDYSIQTTNFYLESVSNGGAFFDIPYESGFGYGFSGPYIHIVNTSLAKASVNLKAENTYILHLKGKIFGTNHPNFMCWLSTSPSSIEYSDITDIMRLNSFIQDAPAEENSFEKYLVFKTLESTSNAYLHILYPSVDDNKNIVDIKTHFEEISLFPAVSKNDKIENVFPFLEKERNNIELEYDDVIPSYPTGTGDKVDYTATSARPGSFLYFTEVDINNSNFPITKKLILPNSEEAPIISNQTETQYFINLNNDKIKYIALPQYQTERIQKTGNSAKKVRTLIAEKSNRFNLLQELSTLFEGYIRYNINYDKEGNILRDSEGRLEKSLTFSEEVGQKIGSGFHYSVNLSGITKTLNSEQIISKLWVEPSESVVSETGLIAIEDAPQNKLGTPFIYDFSYYINKGIIDKKQYDRDYYGTTDNEMCFEKKMQESTKTIKSEQALLDKINKEINSIYITREEAIAKVEALKSEAKKIGLKLQNPTYYSNWEELSCLKGKYYIVNFYGTLYIDSETIGELLTDLRKKLGEIDSYYANLINYNNQLGYEKYRDGIYDNYHINDISFPLGFNQGEAVNYLTGGGLIGEYYNQKQVIDKLSEERNNIITTFEQKYSRYITDGSWSDSNYTDSDKYYLDACKVLKDSSKPTASYSIDLVNDDIQYEVGDQTFVTDIDLFGYDDIGRPYQEEMMITEITEELDHFNETSITIQNFQSDFEDLFDKISATVQTVQLKDGIYSRAANFTADGQINPSVFQNTLSNNFFDLVNSANNSFKITDNGAELININGRKIKLFGEGIFLTNEQGEYTAALTAEGLNASLIMTGHLNTQEISIGNIDNPNFSWNRLGISAYKTEFLDVNGTDNDKEQVYSSFVRYDQHGLYFVRQDNANIFGTVYEGNRGTPWYYNKNYFGKKDEESINWADRIKYVQDNSDVSLTWDGLLIKSQDGAVEISTKENSIKIKDIENKEKVFLGKTQITEKGVTKDYYGILIKNNNEEIVFKADDEGNLSITGEINATSGSIGSIFLATDAKGSIFATDNGSISGRKTWSIDGNGNAYFENAYVNGTLGVTRFKAEEVQTSSGTILVRPATKINEVSYSNSQYKIEIEESIFNVGDYFCLQSRSLEQEDSTALSKKYYGYITFIDGKVVYTSKLYDFDLFDTDSSNYIAALAAEDGAEIEDLTIFKDGTIINFGGDGDAGIIINGNTNKIFSAGGETITFYKNNQGIREITTVLGKLDEVGYINEYGLYSGNVYLNGDIESYGSYLMSTYTVESTSYSPSTTSYDPSLKLNFSNNQKVRIIKENNKVQNTINIQTRISFDPIGTQGYNSIKDLHFGTNYIPSYYRAGFFNKKGNLEIYFELPGKELEIMEAYTTYTIELNYTPENNSTIKIFDNNGILQKNFSNIPLKFRNWENNEKEKEYDSFYPFFEYWDSSVSGSLVILYSCNIEIDHQEKVSTGFTSRPKNNRYILWAGARAKDNDYDYSGANFYIDTSGGLYSISESYLNRLSTSFLTADDIRANSLKVNGLTVQSLDINGHLNTNTALFTKSIGIGTPNAFPDFYPLYISNNNIDDLTLWAAVFQNLRIDMKKNIIESYSKKIDNYREINFETGLLKDWGKIIGYSEDGSITRTIDFVNGTISGFTLSD